MAVRDGESRGNEREDVELLAEEFIARHRRGERPGVDEYALRRPDLAAEIREVFPTLLLVEAFGKESADPLPPVPAAGALQPTREAAGAPGAVPAAGLQQVGEYRILREIGRGGMGIVYEAEQESLGRRVAIKVLPFHSLLGAKHLERFHEEARAAARLSHPNIVPVFGLGEHLGLHYFVMQYIPGQGLDAVIGEVRRLRKEGRGGEDGGIASGLSTGAGQHYHQNVARIARDAALALDHAHREGVLHRDVKPSNLLLDPTGHVWLADFGLAKSEGSDDLTRSGDFVGTYRYMPPERFKGWSDPRSDVYSLGLTLYELLALRPAFVESDRGRLIRRVTAEDPPPPRRFDRAVPRDLETIVLKATAKEPAQRYASAGAMAQDLERYLRRQPVEARRSTPLGRLARWCARNPVLAGLGSAVLVLLLAIASISSRYAVELKRERDLGREKLRDSYLAHARLLRGSRQPGQRYGALHALGEAAKISHGSDLCDEAAAAVALEDARLVRSWTKSSDGVAWFDADVGRVALSDRSGEVVVRSTADDRELVRLPGPGYEIPYVHMAFHPDGRHLAVRFHKYNVFDRWTIWDLEREEAVARVDDGASTGGIAFDPRDGSVVVAARGGVLRTIEVSSGRTLLEQRFPSEVARVEVHPGGHLMALAVAAGLDCHLVEKRSGRTLRAFRHPMQPTSIAWDPRGRLLATACYDRRAYLWDAETGVLRWSQEHEAAAVRTGFHPRGDFFLTAGWDGKIHAWEAWSGRELFVLPRLDLQLSRDGTALGTVSAEGYDRLEIAPTPTWFTLHGHEHPIDRQPHMVALEPGGRLAVSCGSDGVRVWDLISRQEAAHLPIGQVYSAEFEPGGAHLITCGQLGLWRWPIRSRLAGRRRRVVLGPPASVTPLDDLWRHSSADGGRKLAFIHRQSHGHVLSLDEPGPGTRLEDVWPVERIACSPDGRWVAGTSKALNRVVVWDARSGKKARTFEALHGVLVFDPKGRYLVVGARSEHVLYRTADWEVARRLPRTAGLSSPGAIAFDGTGEVMALALTDSRIRLVEVESGRPITELEAPDPRSLTSLALDLAGGFLGASTSAQRCHFWDLRAIERQLATAGLPWGLRCRGAGPTREPLRVDTVHGGSVLGWPEELEDPRAPPLFRTARHALFRPALESHGDIDEALAAPRFLVPEGAAWRLFRGVMEPSAGLEWTLSGFDDAGWPQGASGFSGQRVKDHEWETLLGDQIGSFTTLYVRHAFELEASDELVKLLLALRFEDGFVAYLNGKEVARCYAGAPGTRLGHDARADSVAGDYAPSREFLATVDRSLLVPGKNVLAVQGLVHHPESYLVLLPVLAAVLSPDEERDRRRTEGLAKGPDGAPDLALATYRAGRIHERAGKLEEALAEYGEALGLDTASPEPVVRSIACRRRRGEANAAEAMAREALERGGLLDDSGVWAEWSLATFADLRRPLAGVLASWPGAAAAASRHGADLRSTVDDLADLGAVRINCGGPRLESGDGKAWSADRFFLSGTTTQEEPAPLEGLESSRRESARLDRSSRTFPGGRQVRPAYRVPLPAGRYAVSLHFSEVDAREPGGRVFGALLERQVVLEGYEPLGAGLAAPDVQSFEVEVRDGFLDLDFLTERGNPLLSGLELERRE